VLQKNSCGLFQGNSLVFAWKVQRETKHQSGYPDSNTINMKTCIYALQNLQKKFILTKNMPSHHKTWHHTYMIWQHSQKPICQCQRARA